MTMPNTNVVTLGIHIAAQDVVARIMESNKLIEEQIKEGIEKGFADVDIVALVRSSVAEALRSEIMDGVRSYAWRQEVTAPIREKILCHIGSVTDEVVKKLWPPPVKSEDN